MGGYQYDNKTKTFPVFINYDKADDIQDTIKYEDRFLSPDKLIAISKQPRKKESNVVVMANTDKSAVEIEWILDTPVREDIYECIING